MANFDTDRMFGSALDELLRKRGILPPSMTSEALAGQQKPPATPDEFLAQLSQMNRQDPRSLVGGINDAAQPLLQRLGPIGRGVSRGVDFLEKIGDAGRSAAERGVLGGIAPRFSAGVQAEADRRMQEAYQNASLDIQRERNRAAQASEDKRRVQGVHQLSNGNLGIVMNDPAAPEGFRVVDSGAAYRQTNRYIEYADGSIDLFDNDGQLLRTVRSPEQAREDVVAGAVNTQEAKDIARAPESIKSATSQINEVTDVRNKVNQLLGDVGITTTGPLGAVLQIVPGFDARDFAGLAKEVTSYLSLDKIAEMKSQSATGATGLGAVNEREFDALATARVNLEQAQSPAAVREALRRLLAILSRIEQTAQADIDRVKELQGADKEFEGFSIER